MPATGKPTRRRRGTTFVVLAWASAALAGFALVRYEYFFRTSEKGQVSEGMAKTTALNAAIAIGLAVVGMAGMGRAGTHRVLPAAILGIALALITLVRVEFDSRLFFDIRFG